MWKYIFNPNKLVDFKDKIKIIIEDFLEQRIYWLKKIGGENRPRWPITHKN
jgi:hypothetical protein